MNIKLFSVIFFVLIVNSINAQSLYEQWPSLKSYHDVLSQTFHPAEEGNFEPIITRSEELYNKSIYLLKSDIPEDFRTKSIFDELEKLQLKSKSLNELVLAKAKSDQLLKSITEVHDSFHEIVGLCTNDK